MSEEMRRRFDQSVKQALLTVPTKKARQGFGAKRSTMNVP